MVRTVPPPANLVDDSQLECDVIVACVTYNSAAVIERQLEALPAALDNVQSCRVVIVDNDSQDGTAELIRSRAPWVTVLEAGFNAGYAGGINLAMEQGRGRRGVYILNPDAIPSPGSVSRLARAVEDCPEVGIAVPVVRGAHRQLKFSLRREPTILRAAGEAVLGGHRAARFAVLGDMIRDPAFYRDGAVADWATGAAMFVSRRAVDAVGGWDERFFLYSEETDFALRSRDAGYRLQLVMDAEVAHPGGEMSKDPYLWSLVAANRTRLYRKRHGRVASYLFWSIVLINEGLRGMLGRETHRAAVRALLRMGPNPSSDLVTLSLIGQP